jgi:hypothetical protein
MWQLIEALQVEQAATEVTINQVIAGVVVNRKNRRMEHIDDRIRQLTNRYDRGQSNVLDYITGVSHNLASY